MNPSKHGWPHAKLRKQLLEATLATGRIPLCTYCDELLPLDTSKWHLAHKPDGVTYRGWAHASCNSADHPVTTPRPWLKGKRVAGASEAAKGRRQRKRRRQIIVPDED